MSLPPTAPISAEPASGREGGIHRRAPEGLSKPLGFAAVWCQWGRAPGSSAPVR
ncbi:hypothetical protein [Kitasatospora cathayae]|uniref:Uncharacterized protein n=1 Tax=Kitasatospora cathayae TaxID=3004092 RepID=A0ABY7Q821_9ACTN|nr:hypothetical protein [Kitasatospora sp. HUAS 3-15]WBP88329.1 hypothetical protein O1G21_22485 [Kitasatospora sp. HUAS 3-15]